MSELTKWAGARLAQAAKATGVLTVLGAPAVRAALHGARLGAGKALSPAVLERLGVVVGEVSALRGAAPGALARAGQEVALVLERGGRALRVGAKGLALRARDGVSLELRRDGGVTAAVPAQAVSALARGTARFALRGVGRAAAQGAVAGALLDGGAAAVVALGALRRGELDGRTALRRVGLRTARGAVAGAAGVAAAGAVSAGLAATGLAVVGLPVALPLAAMAATSVYVAQAFDRATGEPEAALPEGP